MNRHLTAPSRSAHLRMLSPTDGWAMGDLYLGGGDITDNPQVSRAIALHYDGAQWAEASTGASGAARVVDVLGQGSAWSYTTKGVPEFIISTQRQVAGSGATCPGRSRISRASRGSPARRKMIVGPSASISGPPPARSRERTTHGSCCATPMAPGISTATPHERVSTRDGDFRRRHEPLIALSRLGSKGDTLLDWWC